MQVAQASHVPITVHDRGELGRMILDMAEDNGWGDDHPTARWHAFTSKGDLITTKQETRKPDPDDMPMTGGVDQAVPMLSRALISMAGEVRRTLAQVTDALNHRDEMAKDMLHDTMDAWRSQAEAERTALTAEAVVELLSDQLEATPNGSDEGQGVGAALLERIADKVLPGLLGGEQAIDLDAILGDEDFMDRVAAHPEAINAIQQAAARAAAKATADAAAEADVVDVDEGGES